MPNSIAYLGIGGQGIVYAASVTAEYLFLKGYNVSQLQSYGAEVRGGTVLAYTVYSEGEIINPFIESFDIVIVLHETPLSKWIEHIEDSKIVIVDRDLVKTRLNNTLEAPILQKAVEKNLYNTINMIGVGIALNIAFDKIDDDLIEKILSKRKNYEQNIKSYIIGKEIARELKVLISR